MSETQLIEICIVVAIAAPLILSMCEIICMETPSEWRKRMDDIFFKEKE